MHNNNGKQNPDDIVLYLYTTYDNNSFDPISITIRSFPIILVHHRGFCNVDGFQLSVGMKLQIVIFTVCKIREVAVDKILHLRPQLRNQGYRLYSYKKTIT